MERRKFVIGMGSLAAGGAAAMGSGAFTSVEAERDFALSVAEDSDAFLSIEVEDPEHAGVDDNNNMVELAFDGEATGEGADGADGSGINKNATTRFDEVIKITNQGTENIHLYFVTDQEDVNEGRAERTRLYDDQGTDLTYPENNARELTPGTGTTIDFEFETKEGTRIGDFASDKLIVAQTEEPSDDDFKDDDVRDDDDPHQE